MSFTSREIVRKTLCFDSPPRPARDLWILSWAQSHYPRQVNQVLAEYPPDIAAPQKPYNKSARAHGNPCSFGNYTDEWGCTFKNKQTGVEGILEAPLLDTLEEAESFTPPYDILPQEIDAAREDINHFCAKTDKFTIAPTSIRPWERYQFLRGTENALMDIAMNEKKMWLLLDKIHRFYIEELRFWAKTDVDAIFFADDWGSQKQMLISPDMWKNIFKPLYEEYIQIVHNSGKFIFYRSNGYILEILPELVNLDIDAINCQLACMPLAQVAKIGKGHITFWGEIDRQKILPSPDPQVARQEVDRIAKELYSTSGGIIAQCQFGPAANPECVKAVFQEWQKIHDELSKQIYSRQLRT